MPEDDGGRLLDPEDGGGLAAGVEEVTVRVAKVSST